MIHFRKSNSLSGLYEGFLAKLSHLDEAGKARMVDVSGKPETARSATATGRVSMSKPAFDALSKGDAKKGDVLAVARVAGIQAAKRTSEWIPLCHTIPLSSVTVDFALDEKERAVQVTANATCIGRTGVEMEALVAVSCASLTIYDMLKAVDRGIVIDAIKLLAKSGGKSGDWTAP